MMNVSVIIPVYNAEHFLEKAVNSALQFDEVKEILLIEDASPDSSLEVCKRLTEQHERIKVLQHPDKGNHGAGATRNLGLEKATQEYISFLDADDYYLPNRFEVEKELFKDPKIEGVFGAIGVEFLSEKGKHNFQEKFKNTTLTTVKKHAEGESVFYGLLSLDRSFGSFFHLNGLTVRRAALHKNNLRFNSDLRLHQDTDFIYRLSYHCYLKSGNISEAVAMRGVHDNNRITGIKAYTPTYNEHQLKLWTSLANWAKDKDIKKDCKKHIRRQQTAFQLSVIDGIHRYFCVALHIIKDPKILKTRYRYLYLKI